MGEILDTIPLGPSGNLSTGGLECPAMMAALYTSNLALRTSTAWFSNNLAVYIPVVVPVPFTVYGFSWTNGVTVSATNNVDAGLYDSDYNQVTHTGSTAQGTSANTGQYVSVTAVSQPAGAYYLALACDNTAATFFMVTVTAVVALAHGCGQQATAMALPATGTLAVYAQTGLPLVSAMIETATF